MPTATLDRPFGLTKAVPVTPRPEDHIPAMDLCPTRQVSVTPDGEPYIHTPAMTTQGSSSTSYTTTTDHQQWTDSDTAPTVDQ